jgi:archaellum component FlaC
MDDKRIERIEAKIDDIGEHINDTNVILAKQHESLKDHMRRTELLEEAIKPVQKHVSMVDGAMRLIGITAALAAIVEGVRLLFR